MRITFEELERNAKKLFNSLKKAKRQIVQIGDVKYLAEYRRPSKNSLHAGAVYFYRIIDEDDNGIVVGAFSEFALIRKPESKEVMLLTS